MPEPHAALHHLHEFCDRILPGLLRRLRCWKGLDPRRHADVIDDLRQDLALDCLEHAAEIEALPQAERWSRWSRLVQRGHYRLRVRGQHLHDAEAVLERVDGPPRPADSAELPDSAVGAADPDLARPLRALVPPQRELVTRLLWASSRKKNGRINLDQTSRDLGHSHTHLRRAWSGVAGALGYGPEFNAFWTRRLVEALLGLGADLLRDRGVVQLHDEHARPRPDPEARLRRIRSIRRHLSARPQPTALRAELAGFGRGCRAHTLEPDHVFATAERLAPDDYRVHHWRFEAAVAQGRLADAAAALRRARQTAPQAGPESRRDARVRDALARARLLEARGLPCAAAQLLAAKSPRLRHDARLRAALRGLLRA